MKSIILAGGSGSRLWPLSREQYPKQFLKMNGVSLFQDTINRCLEISDISEIFIVTSESQKFFVLGQTKELGCDIPEKNILVEPIGKNTLPAICYGMSEIKKRFGECVVGVFPSDHVMDHRAMNAIISGEKLALDHIVVFGVVPRSPHTGYGYIKPAIFIDGGYTVEEFKEKPTVDDAEKYIKGGFLWNSGMLLLSTDVFFAELMKYMPNIFDAFRSNDITNVYNNVPSISIDYGIIEKSDRVAVIRLDYRWSDLGNFDSIYDEFKKNGEKNVVRRSDSILINSHNNMIYSEYNKLVSLINVNDMVVVDTVDALLVCPRDSSQNVKDVVRILKENNDERVRLHKTVYRPWGSYTILQESERYKIKNITVMPMHKLSLQLHHHRSEHWVVVKGMACIEIDGCKSFLRPGESTFIMSGVRHRLSNPGKLPLEMIEIQLGDSVDEDDIVRFDDEYGRAK